jgi:head-tail adaptor
MTRFLVHPVTLQAPRIVTNAYGDTVADWSVVTEYEETGWFTRTSTEEMAEGREAITDLYELTLPPGSAITESMRVLHDGDCYEIRGSVERADTPAGTHHLVAHLRRVAG